MTTSIVTCPRCGKSQPRRGEHAIYYCDKCKGQFDNDPDEGGDFSDRNPGVRIEREEQRKDNRNGRGR